MELKSRDIVQFGVNVNVEKKCKCIEPTTAVKAIAPVDFTIAYRCCVFDIRKCILNVLVH